jgi:hypothetical protein
MRTAIDAAYFREKVRICLRLAAGLPWNSPERYQLLLMAEDFQFRETELETALLAQKQQCSRGAKVRVEGT